VVKISEIISESNGPTFSIELWPPRSKASEIKLAKALPIFESLNPSFASVTFGAGGSTREKTYEMVVRLRNETSIETMAHLVTAAHSRDQLKIILQRYHSAGVRNILALKGDPPLDNGFALEQGELKHAIDLVELVREVGDFSVAVAAHPEGHPESVDIASDRYWLAKKLEFADFAISQFFFNISDYFSLVDDMAKYGIEKPILPGVMAPVSVRTLEKMALLSGAKIPAEVHRRFSSIEDDPESVKKLGVELALELSTELLRQGAPGIHLYTMNEAETAYEIFKGLGLG
jgi:methylenetetrahydrofolate reductase (NADPH)